MTTLVPIVLFLFTFSVYLLTSCATFNIADSGETITVCNLMAISHSPGYPLHALWGRLNCLLPLGQPMLRVTLSSMITGSLGVVMLYLLLNKILKEIFSSLSSVPAATEPKSIWMITEFSSLFGALVFASSTEHWFESCGAKGGIYTLNTLVTITMFFLLFKMRENNWFIKSSLLMCFIFGLGLTNHWQNQVVMTPAYLWFFLAGQKRVPFTVILKSLLRPFDMWNNIRNISSALGFSNILRGLTFGLLSLSVYLYLPIRSSQNQVLNWWNPRTFSKFWGTIIRESYNFENKATGWAMISRNMDRFFLSAHDQYGPFFTYFILILTVLGFRWLWDKKCRSTAFGFLIFAGIVLTTVVFYMGLPDFLVWALDYFFPPVYLAIAILSAAGMAALGQWFTANIRPSSRALSMIVLSSALALIPLLLNYRSNDQSHYVAAYDEGMNMLQTVKEGSVIICNGDIDVLPLWYLRFSQGKRPDVAPFTLQLMSYGWYQDLLFKHWPFLTVPIGGNMRPDMIAQAMIAQHSGDRSFYFTNVATPSWLQDKNPSIPEGLLWRISNTRNLGYPFTSAGLNQFWGNYRLRYLNPPERGYWDDYTEYVKATYGLGLELAGIYATHHEMYEPALWSFNHALDYSQVANIAGIYTLEGETRLALNDPTDAVLNFQEALKHGRQNADFYSEMGDAYLRLKDAPNARSAFETALATDPNQKKAFEGLQRLEKKRIN